MNLATLKVLLLEDSTATAQLITGLVNSAPASAPTFAVEHIDRLARAEARLAAGDVDLILLDLNWPDGHELDALARLGQWAARWPVIVLTEHEDEALALQVRQLGAQDCLAKDTLNRPLLLRAARYAIERHHAESQRREEEELYHALAETAGDAIITIDEQSRMLYVNAATSRIFGYKRDELIGQPLTMLMPAFMRDQHLRGFARSHTTDQRQLSWQTIEMSGLHRSGREMPLEISFGEFIWQGQRILTGIARDITERKQNEAALRENEHRFRALFENSWDGVVLIEAAGLVTYASPAITRILGYEVSEYLHTNALSYLHPEDHQRVWQTLAALLPQAGASVTIEYRYRHKDNSWRWIECTGTNLLAEPNVEAIVCNYRDITEHKQSEQSLRASEERFRALIEHSWDGLLLLTASGEMLYASPSTRRIMGHVGDEILAQNAFALMHPEDLPQIIGQLQGLITRPEATINVEFRYQHKDGSWRWLECTGTNLLEAPSVGAIVINYRDITERKLNETALCQARNELEQRVAERTGDLQQHNQKLAQLYEEVQASRRQLRRLSHRLVEAQENERRAIARELHDEVGQILTGLKMNLEVARRLPPAAIAANLAHAQGQLDDLMGRVRNLSLDLRPAMLDDLGLLPALFWLFDRYTAQTKVQVKCKHVDIEGRYAPELETATYRIVQEALTNVARHSRADEVVVLLWTTPDSLWAQIEDQGAGFDAERVIAAGHSSGLTGMRERALLLGGQLTIESAPGGGARITAELPLLKLAQKLPAHDATLKTA
jgi:PAS domain S-box-containing protein